MLQYTSIRYRVRACLFPAMAAFCFNRQIYENKAR